MYNNVELLEIGISALNFGTIQDMQNALKVILNSCDIEVGQEACSNMLRQNMTIIPNKTLPLYKSDIEINLKFYCEALWHQIQKQSRHDNFVSYRSMKILYDKSQSFKSKDILYSNNSDSLNVSDFLDTIKYCLDLVDIVFDINTEKYSNYITALKGLDRFLNNKDDNKKNLLKDLGYVLEVLIAVGNHFEENEVAKKENKVTAILVGLSIKFLAE